ncbi:MAG: acyl-[ACP]--phospholipid O-acyltransferase [Campylobacter sp.]|nr:acyl-[ACP]--phospholipid O-acyltransferase [Campylobacter sp.]
MKALFSIRGFLPFIIILFLNATVDLAHKVTIQNVIMKTYEGSTQIWLTALINLLIVLPYIGLFSLSGYLNDKISKTYIIRACAFGELFFVGLILLAYINGWFYFAFAVTLILGAQSAVYSPAKMGLIKTIVGDKNLGLANGLAEGLTIVAILLSTFLFSIVFELNFTPSDDPSKIMQSVWFIGLFIVGISAFEALTTLILPYYKPSHQNSQFNLKEYAKLKYLRKNLSFLTSEKTILLCVLGLAFFWGVAQLALAVFPGHFKSVTGSNNVMISNFITMAAALGIAVGSVACGNLCKNRIELGVVPFGAVAMGLALALISASTSVFWMASWAFLFGFGGGIFIVPLNSTIQHLAKNELIGRIIAGSNFVQNNFMVLFLFITMLIAYLQISTKGIFLFAAMIMVFCFCLSIRLLPHLFARIFATPFFKFGYKISIQNSEFIPRKGGVLLLGNHVSFIDWFVVQIACFRPVKFVMHKSYYEIWYIKWILRIFKVIPIGGGYNKSAIKQIRTYLDNGEVVALFPEGHLSYNGQIGEFLRGYELASKNSNCVIVPFYIGGLWGSTFSRGNPSLKRGMFKERKNISITFGKLLSKDIEAKELRNEVVKLSFYNFEAMLNSSKTLPYNWLDRANLSKFIIADSNGYELNSAKFITLILLFWRHLPLGEGKNVGIILPTSVVNSAVNLLVMIRGKVCVNLNYTLNEDILLKCVRKAEISTIVTSRKFVNALKNRGFKLEKSLSNKLVFIEDIAKNISDKERKIAFFKAILMPKWLIKKLYFTKTSLDDEAAILFSSGSEGEPKGVVLTHKNILANIGEIVVLLNSDKKELMLASLPTFHSFGFCVCMCLPLNERLKSVCVSDPTDAYLMGKMSAKYSATIMFGTNSFFRIYTKNKKLSPLMFSHIRVAISGAEKLNLNVKNEFKMKFGIDILEGYGATETSPVISVNTPNLLDLETYKEIVFNKTSSAGLPLPFTVVNIVDENEKIIKEPFKKGQIFVGGAQIMKGYYKDEAKTAKVITYFDGMKFYKTGDIGYFDEDGFLYITDRISRFVKIGGEMISLGYVESRLESVLNCEFALTSKKDEKKGEKIVLVYSGDMQKSEILEWIKRSDLTPIMTPSEFIKVDEIPRLGTGKIDFAKLKDLV